MRKTNQMFLALLLMMVGAVNANAAETSLQDVKFWQHEVWGDEPKTTEAECAWVIGESTGQPYGDSGVNNFADLSQYTKLMVTVTEGTPRFLLNRDVDDGQWNEDESQSHLIDNTRGGWSAKYFSSEAGANEGETVYTVDLKQLVKDKGYAYLHAIKGANWQNVTVTDMVVVSAGSKPQEVGWTNIINNSDMEGDDNSSFFTKVAKGDPLPSEILDGVGVEGSRGIMVEATDKVSDPWDNQFWFRFNEPLVAGTKYRVKFDYRADEVASASTQAHAEPSDYIWYEMFGNIEFATDWQTFELEGEVTTQQSTDEKKFLSVAFNLNEKAEANNYYFDNIVFQVYKYGTTAEYSSDVIMVGFGFDTNIPELVKQAGAKRVFFNNDCATVKVNGQEAAIYSIEGCDDGRFYIFMEEPIDEDATVEVNITNNIGLVYTAGPNNGNSVDNFSGIATFNPDVEDDTMYPEPYPYAYCVPSVMKTDPDNGSFNLPAGTTITVYFDKEADCAALEATANGSALTISPSTGFSKEVTLSGSLSDGENVIVITKIYPELRLADEIFGTYEFTLSVGQSDFSEQPYDVIPGSYFTDCAVGGVPEGFVLYADGFEERLPGGNYSSGNRMMEFGNGGDFTRGLYMRTWYLEYGSQDGHEMNLEGGKKYKTTFNSCMWNSGGTYMKFEVADEAGNVVFDKVVTNAPNVSESRNAVSGTTYTDVSFEAPADGKYIARWYVAKDANGTPTDDDWSNGVILANVKMQFMPNAAGIEYIMMLNQALENAKTTLEANSDERYQGSAFSTLQSLVNQYDGWSATSPSAYKDAVAELEAASQALKDHRANCDAYDAAIKKAIDVVRQNEQPNGDPTKATKFTKTELFAQLKAVVDKYHGTSEWQNVNEDPEGEAQWQLFYSYDVLTDDYQLTSATAELTDIANLTAALFTEGESNDTDSGVKVLVERLRLGAEALKALPGVAEDDADVAAAFNALTDDDALAEQLQARIKARVYNELNNPATTLFQETVDEMTLETTVEPVDMSVFIKNPNIYAKHVADGVNEDNVPGWNVFEGPNGGNGIGLYCGWGGAKNIDGVAEDCAFTVYHNEGTMENEISGLPAGLYRVTIKAALWDGEEGSYSDESFGYYKTSKTPEGEYEATENLGWYQQYDMGDVHPIVFEDVAIEEGDVLTLGVLFASDDHQYFFKKVAVEMTGALPGYQYPTMDEPEPQTSKKGDVNGDGAVNVADISMIIDIMAGAISDADKVAAADVNGDNAVNVADISAVIDIMAAQARALRLALGQE